MSVFVVVPAFNEARSIRAAVVPLLEAGYRVVIVDDASTDETSNAVRDLDVTVVRHAVNLGQGAALQTGTELALRAGADFVVHFDADGQHRAEDVAVLLAPLRTGEADVALGSRFLREADARAVPPRRRVLLRWATVANRVLTGVRITDAHNGIRALTRDAASRIVIQENRSSHATEILAQIRRLGLRLVEHPVHVRYTDYSMAKGQRAWAAFDIVWDSILGRIFR